MGDDWQSIYAFSGSRIEYIYRFNNFFKGSKNFKITKTYRNSQELIDCTGKFIMKNEAQIKKQLTSDKHINNPIVYKMFDGTNGILGEINCLKETILEIHKENPEYKILVLARTNQIVNSILYDDIQIDGMTMHKSKGLTYDAVIIIGLDKKFPSAKTNTYWYEDLYKNKPINEPIPFAEERRLFYVALTRTRNKVYLIIDQNEKFRSDFVKEINEMSF